MPKTNSSRSQESLKTTFLYPVLSYWPARWWLPTSHSLFLPAYSEATIESGFFGSHPFAKRVHGEKESPGSLGSWDQGMFLFMLKGSTLSSGEMRDQTVIVLTHLCLKIKMR